MRREMSVSEKVLWVHLRNDKLGFRFRRQYRIDPYFLDFYCPEAKLCIEVDGEQHALRLDKDAIRDAKLAALGIETYRIPSLDLFDLKGDGMAKAIPEILRRCEARTGRTGIRDWE